ncbi:MAG: GPR endopeptidase [Bacillota bacterium]
MSPREEIQDWSESRTDIAIEAHNMVTRGVASSVPGVRVEERAFIGGRMTRVTVETEEGAQRLGKKRGQYVTIESPSLRDRDPKTAEQASEHFAFELRRMAGLKPNATVLVVGLGNFHVTPDSLGPKVVDQLFVTRHLLEHMPEQMEDGVRPVCAMAPGVLGLTGIETGEIVQGVVNRIKPDLIVAVDALAARSLERINATIQLANTGITPGSGIGNKRQGITIENIGVPVIAVGVPTVVEAATVVNDSLDLMLDSMIKQTSQGSEFYTVLKGIDREEKRRLIREVLNPYVGNLMVTPKEIDYQIEHMAHVIAQGINIAMHPTIDFSDNSFIH